MQFPQCRTQLISSHASAACRKGVSSTPLTSLLQQSQRHVRQHACHELLRLTRSAATTRVAQAGPGQEAHLVIGATLRMPLAAVQYFMLHSHASALVL